MGDGFTGIDFDGLNNGLRKIEDSYDSLMVGLTDRLSVFFFRLRKEWASQNAYNASLNWHAQINGYLKSIRELYDRIYSDIVTSGLKYASNMGENWNPHNQGYLISSKTTISEEEVILNITNSNGVSGMNIRLVQDLLDAELPNIRSLAIDDVEKMPAAITIYDDNGEQAQTYSTRKQTILNIIDELLTSLENTIRGYILIEKDNILLAKQQTVQNMNGGNTSANA